MSNKIYVIETLELKHAQLLADWFNTFVDQDLGVVENFHVTVESEEKYIRDYLANLQNGEASSYVVLCNKIIVGKTDIRPLSRYIDKHVVELGFGVLKEHPEAGKQLLQFVGEEIKKRGFEVALYFILARNHYFRDIFKAVGFKEVGEIIKFYKIKEDYDNRIILEKILT